MARVKQEHPKQHRRLVSRRGVRNRRHLKAHVRARRLADRNVLLETRIGKLEREKEYYKCPVCRDHERDIVLLCGHTLCADCWATICGMISDEGKCPMDRAYTRKAAPLFQ